MALRITLSSEPGKQARPSFRPAHCKYEMTGPVENEVYVRKIAIRGKRREKTRKTGHRNPSLLLFSVLPLNKRSRCTFLNVAKIVSVCFPDFAFSFSSPTSRAKFPDVPLKWRGVAAQFCPRKKTEAQKVLFPRDCGAKYVSAARLFNPVFVTFSLRSADWLAWLEPSRFCESGIWIIWNKRPRRWNGDWGRQKMETRE